MSTSVAAQKPATAVYMPGGNQSPRLESFDELESSAFRFKSFAFSHCPGMMRSITLGNFDLNFTNEAGVTSTKTADMLDDKDFRKVDEDSKSYGFLIQALSEDLIHYIENCETAKEIWDELKKRFDGNVAMRKSKKELLNTRFNAFNHMQGESIESIITRFHRLSTTMRRAGLTNTTEEMNIKLLLSMPISWDQNVRSISNANDLEAIGLNDLISINRAYEMEDKQRLTNHINSVNNSAIGAISSASVLLLQGGSTPTNPYSHLTLHQQLLYGLLPQQMNGLNIVSGNSSSTPAANDTPPHSPVLISQHKSSREERPHPTKSDNLGWNIFEGTYENLIHGNQLPSHMTPAELTEYNDDDVGEMDIKYQMAMAVMRATRFVKKHGNNKFKNFEKGNIMFDKSKMRCYNCDEPGHMARECSLPRKSNEDREKIRVERIKKEKSKTQHGEEESSKALASQVDNNYNWDSSQFSQLETLTNHAYMEITSESPTELDEV